MGGPLLGLCAGRRDDIDGKVGLCCGRRPPAGHGVTHLMPGLPECMSQ